MANETTSGKARPAPAPSTTDPAPPGATPPAQPVGAPATNPATAAIADAARKSEIAALTKQRDELRELIGEASELDMLRAEVHALQEAAVRAGVTRAHRWHMSAGVASDLELNGYAVDPATGDAYVRDGDQVAVTSRSGAVRTIDMPMAAAEAGPELAGADRAGGK